MAEQKTEIKDEKPDGGKTMIGTPADTVEINPISGEDPNSVEEGLKNRFLNFHADKLKKKAINEAFQLYATKYEYDEESGVPRVSYRGRLTQEALDFWLKRVRRQQVQKQIIDNA